MRTCPKYEYYSSRAGHIKVDRKWELIFAEYLDELGVRWERNKPRFPYINLKNRESTYCPVFFVYDWNEHIEIKGYKTELDECKWRQFPVEEKLSVWHKKDLKRINIIK